MEKFQRKTSAKYKILKQDNDCDNDDHITPKEEETKLVVTETPTQITETPPKQIDQEAEIKDTSVLKGEERSDSKVNSCVYNDNNDNRLTTVSSREKTGSHLGYLDIPEITYEEITDTEDFDVASDEEIPNKISNNQNDDAGYSNGHPLKQNSGSDSSAPTELENFSDHKDIKTFMFFKPKKPYHPLVVMNEEADDLEDVFLPCRSKHSSSFQKFMSEQSSFISNTFNDDILTDTEAFEINVDETLAFSSLKNDYADTVLHCIDSQQLKLHKEQLTCSTDKNYNPGTVCDFADHRSLGRTNESSNVLCVNMVDSHRSCTEMEESVKCSCDKKFGKTATMSQSQAKLKAFNNKTLPVPRPVPDSDTDVEDLSDNNPVESQKRIPHLKITHDPDTDIEDLSDNNAVETDCSIQHLKQKMKRKFNKQCYEGASACMEKNKFCLQHQSSVISFTKCSENLSTLENALTDMEEFDMSGDDSQTEKSPNSYKFSSACSKGDEGFKQLAKVVIPKAVTSYNNLDRFVIDDGPLTDTEEVNLSDVDITYVDETQSAHSSTYFPRYIHNSKK